MLTTRATAGRPRLVRRLATAALLTMLLTALGGMVPMPARAVDCKGEIASTEASIAHVESQLAGVREQTRRRVQSFLGDARRLLEEARDECGQADTTLKSAAAMGKVLVAQGNVAAAQLVIRVE